MSRHLQCSNSTATRDAHRPCYAPSKANEDVTDLYTRVKVGTRVVVLPGRPPATEAAMPLAPPAGASVLPSDGSVTIAPLGPPPSAMAR